MCFLVKCEVQHTETHPHRPPQVLQQRWLENKTRCVYRNPPSAAKSYLRFRLKIHVILEGYLSTDQKEPVVANAARPGRRQDSITAAWSDEKACANMRTSARRG